MPDRRRDALGLATTLSAGAVGGWLFSVAGLPLPWILGAIFGVMVAARAPLPVGLTMARPPRRLLTPARIVLGLAIGATFESSILENAGLYAASLLFLVPYLVAAGALGTWYFRRIAGFDRPTAFLCAVPGGLAELLVLSDDLRADARRVALIHGIRILVLVYTLPFLAGALSGQTVIGADGPMVPRLLDTSLSDLALLAALGMVGWRALAAAGLSGAAIVGPMLAAAAASLGGLLSQGPPDEIFKIAQWLLGSAVGAVFIGRTDDEVGLLRSLRLSLGHLGILAAVTAATAGAVHLLLGAPFVPALLAFAPGGQAEMSLIALMLAQNPAYVALHHLARLVLIVTLLPPLARRLSERFS